MKKHEFLAAAERTNSKSFGLPFDKNGIAIYHSQQHRWENSADPQVDDVTHHLTEAEAIKAAEAIKCDLGFRPMVEKLFIQEEDLLSIIDNYDEDDDVDLRGVASAMTDLFEVWSGEEYKGDSIEGAIVVEWAWKTYVGYAREFRSIGRAGNYPYHELKHEADLITGNEESTFRSNYSVLLTAKEIEGMSDAAIVDAVNEELSNGRWKWNKIPSDEVIINALELTIEQPDNQ